jgi:hypothetical protein
VCFLVVFIHTVTSIVKGTRNHLHTDLHTGICETFTLTFTLPMVIKLRLDHANF